MILTFYRHINWTALKLRFYDCIEQKTKPNIQEKVKITFKDTTDLRFPSKKKQNGILFTCSCDHYFGLNITLTSFFR